MQPRRLLALTVQEAARAKPANMVQRDRRHLLQLRAQTVVLVNTRTPPDKAHVQAQCARLESTAQLVKHQRQQQRAQIAYPDNTREQRGSKHVRVLPVQQENTAVPARAKPMLAQIARPGNTAVRVGKQYVREVHVLQERMVLPGKRQVVPQRARIVARVSTRTQRHRRAAPMVPVVARVRLEGMAQKDRRHLQMHHVRIALPESTRQRQIPQVVMVQNVQRARFLQLHRPRQSRAQTVPLASIKIRPDKQDAMETNAQQVNSSKMMHRPAR